MHWAIRSAGRVPVEAVVVRVSDRRMLLMRAHTHVEIFDTGDSRLVARLAQSRGRAKLEEIVRQVGTTNGRVDESKHTDHARGLLGKGQLM